MEGNENQVNSLFDQTRNGVTVTASQVNGLFGNTDASHTEPFYPPSTTEKKKRGRPRKYESPEQGLAARKAAAAAAAAAAASAAAASASAAVTSFPSPKHHKPLKPHSVTSGNAGQGFTLQIISLAAGEDVGQKIMMFMQQNKLEICILSASGSISNATLRQPATSGGNITYEGRFDIISLTGSYIRNEFGARSGGLSVCLANSGGQLVGGSIAGPLRAAGPVQVIVGTFSMDTKDTSAGIKGDVYASKSQPPIGDPASSLGFRPALNSSNGNTIAGNEDHQSIGGSHFMLQQSGVHVIPSHHSDWGSIPDSRNASFDLTGRTGHGAHQSPENGDYS